MGTWQSILRRSFLVALFLLLGMAGSAAHAVSLAPATCTAEGDSEAVLLALAPSELDCGPNRFELHAPFVRGVVTFSKLAALPRGRLAWQTDPTSFDSMVIRLNFADGSTRTIDVDAQMAARNWDANGNFWVPIAQGGSPLAGMDVVVERPQSLAVLKRMAIASFDATAQDSYWRTLVIVFVCGLLVIPIVYDLFFYRVLRERFLAWHIVMSVGTVLYVLFNSGVVNLIMPGLTTLDRFGMTFIASAMIMIGASEFSCLIIEQGKCWPRAPRLLPYLNVAAFIVACLVLFDVEMLRTRIPVVFAIVALPVLLIVAATIVRALMQGSRAAKYLLAAYLGILATSLLQLAVTWGLLTQSELLDDWLYFGLITLVLGTAAGVVHRFLVIKSERDRARITARKFGVLATSDGLTGLLNRRAFDRHRRLARGRTLLLLDLDRFKSINDNYGHQTGDAVLVRCARVIEKVLAERCDGEVYRLGGEEFAVVCELANPGDARELSEAIRMTIAREGDHGAEMAELPSVTISIGAICGRGQPMHLALSAADDALYRAKEGGRNRCEILPATAS